MKLLDRIALNRLLSIITSFILSVIKIFSDKNENGIEVDKPKTLIQKLREARKKRNVK